MTLTQRLQKMFHALYDVRRYHNPLERERALLVYGILTLALLLVLVPSFLPVWIITPTTRQSFFETAQADPALFAYPVALISGVVSGFLLIRYRRLSIAAWIPLVMTLVALYSAVFVRRAENAPLSVMVIFATLILISGLLQGYRGVALASGLAFLLTWLFLSLQLPELAPITVMIMAVSSFSLLYLRFAAVNRAVGNDEANLERIKFAEFISQISTRASGRMPLRDLLTFTVDLILQTYPRFYHAQVFLLDEKGAQARLIASTGEPGKVLMERQHSLNVGSVSVIGQVTLLGVPQIEYADRGVHRFNPTLPNTRLEAAFPLRIGTQIIGALDLQCQTDYVFGRQDIAIFQSLADSLSLVIDNVRQYEAAIERVQENQALAEQAQSALREVDRLNKRLIGRAWTEFLRTQANSTGLDYDSQSQALLPRDDWTPTLKEAVAQNTLVQTETIVAVPLRLRGQVIGAMEFELDEDGQFSPEDLELIGEIGERFGLAAENTRLVEESQRVAQREALINDISSRMQSSNNVEATLAEAARSLRETLQANRVTIRLGSPLNAPKGTNAHASR